ncbi:hypothetical protein ANN_12572 [Periplaneta americana]|uniref:Uncharacterized protein n=1 Tax=Periplaneta americana TaxID=6978 RepID=A0ABQ8TGW9_PERAM|nr:hypothetical protein ANN_12572 [Periplaneta americana]
MYDTRSYVFPNSSHSCHYRRYRTYRHVLFRMNAVLASQLLCLLEQLVDAELRGEFVSQFQDCGSRNCTEIISVYPLDLPGTQFPSSASVVLLHQWTQVNFSSTFLIFINFERIMTLSVVRGCLPADENCQKSNANYEVRMPPNTKKIKERMGSGREWDVVNCFGDIVFWIRAAYCIGRNQTSSLDQRESKCMQSHDIHVNFKLPFQCVVLFTGLDIGKLYLAGQVSFHSLFVIARVLRSPWFNVFCFLSPVFQESGALWCWYQAESCNQFLYEVQESIGVCQGSSFSEFHYFRRVPVYDWVIFSGTNGMMVGSIRPNNFRNFIIALKNKGSLKFVDTICSTFPCNMITNVPDEIDHIYCTYTDILTSLVAPSVERWLTTSADPSSNSGDSQVVCVVNEVQLGVLIFIDVNLVILDSLFLFGYLTTLYQLRGLALRNARWFESSWGKKFSHEISASVWDRCPPSIVMYLGSHDRRSLYNKDSIVIIRMCRSTKHKYYIEGRVGEFEVNEKRQILIVDAFYVERYLFLQRDNFVISIEYSLPFTLFFDSRLDNESFNRIITVVICSRIFVNFEGIMTLSVVFGCLTIFINFEWIMTLSVVPGCLTADENYQKSTTNYEVRMPRNAKKKQRRKIKYIFIFWRACSSLKIRIYI